MDYQVLFNIAASIIGLSMGWFMKILYDALRDLRSADMDLSKQVNNLALELPTNYISKMDFKDEIRELSAAIFKKLDKIDDKQDRIEEKLDRKADKDAQ